MTRHDATARIQHMLDHAREAVAMLGDRTAEQLDRDRVLQLALTRLVEIVGEAAAKIPDDVRQRYPAVPWREASSTRNLLIHGYDIVRYDILHATIRENFPSLIDQLSRILIELA